MKKLLFVAITLASLILGCKKLPPFPSDCLVKSLYFDGVYLNNTGDFGNDHVDIGPNGPMSDISSSESYTIEVWAKRGHFSYPSGLERIYSKDHVFQFRVINDQFIGEIGSSSVAAPYPFDTAWHHLAFVRDKATNTLKLFIDGQLKASAVDNSTVIGNNGSVVCIGARNNGIGIYELWTGYLRHLRVSKAARYNSNFTPKHVYGSDAATLGLWTFEEGKGNILNDVSGNNQNGTIVNAMWSVEPCVNN